MKEFLKRHKKLIGFLGFVAIVVGVASADTTPAPSSVTNSLTPSITEQVAAPVYTVPTVSPKNEVESEPALSNDNYYINSQGNSIHSPAYSEDNEVPAGATARCGDGTYSFSQSRRGTCSHHGGVTDWL